MKRHPQLFEETNDRAPISHPPEGFPGLVYFHGYSCQECATSKLKRSTMENHLRRKPHWLKGNELNHALHASKSLVQLCLNKGERVVCIQPALPVEDEAESVIAASNPDMERFVINAEEQLIREAVVVDEANTATSPFMLHPNAKQQQFYNALQFHRDHPALEDIPGLTLLCTATKAPLLSTALGSACTDFIAETMNAIRNAPADLRRSVSSGNGRVACEGRYYRSVNTSPVYARTLASLLSFLLTAKESRNPAVDVQPGVKTALELLEGTAPTVVAIRKVLMELLMESYPITAPYTASVVHLYLYCSHLKVAYDRRTNDASVGQFKSIRSLSSPMAHLLYCFKGALLLGALETGILVPVEEPSQNVFKHLVSWLKLTQTASDEEEIGTTTSFGVHPDGSIDKSTLFVGDASLTVKQFVSANREILRSLEAEVSDLLKGFRLPKDLEARVFDNPHDTVRKESPHQPLGFCS